MSKKNIQHIFTNILVTLSLASAVLSLSQSAGLFSGN